MQLRNYQTEIANKAAEILTNKWLVYLSMEVRTGKTVTALETAKLFGAKKVLFITKKKAIDSIIKDYNAFAFTFDLTVINNESLHTIDNDFDLLISDEHHRCGTYPKPNNVTKLIKKKYGHLPMIFLSGTPHPESYSQIYHQFWLSNHSPFKTFTNFYKFAQIFVNVTQRNFGYAKINDYSNCNYDKIWPIISEYFITYTQKEAGFTSNVQEHILTVKMKPYTYDLIKRLETDKVVQGKNEVLMGDTAVKLMSKVHQLYSGTVKFESGNTMIIDDSKAVFIKEKFKNKIAIFYKFKEELNCLKNIYGEDLTEDLTEFNNTDKSIALQIVSGMEGISLSKAEALVYYNIDFSALSYWQSRDRLTTMNRLTNNVYWVFSEGGIEQKIYQTVIKKKNYTLNLFKKNYVSLSK